ncbi:tripartite tricarboxylate transporter substrate binding protein [Aquincola sp. J276]|uniref:tripartite tricarboxylate transporter substrate binding protein n=1 Tax=Aquincola sp. J276 TaxID=2898432 RepID=UPI002151FA4B|nr:tripartite tricarboxylate transporter substrate binding protein [Aquincola sp. J276]MCR5867283.1 tripartite tricarboxylate transporter substrate binding protein [Aquincola sp. J276]
MTITRRTTLQAAGLAALGLLQAAPARAQDYPQRPIELVVPYAAGGGTDAVARAFAEALKKHLPQSVLVVNKAGAGGAIGFTEVMSSRPDGYKIGVGTVEITMLPHLGVARFSADDFTPIAQLNAEPSAVTVQSGAPWRTLEDFLAHARAKPGEVRIGNSGTGAIWHLAAEQMGRKTGTRFMHVPYAGANPAINDLLGGHIEAVTVSPSEVAQHVAGGKLRLLGVMADQRAARFADVPTLKERGVDVSISTWRGIVVPRRTPPQVVEVLRNASRLAAQEAGFRDALARLDLTHVYADAPDFQKVIERDNAFFKQLMAELGISR